MIKQLYWKYWPYDYRPMELWYKIKCWCWHRYTTVKPRYLGHTWCDCDDLLSHTMFEILSRFIEKECSPGNVDWDYDNEHSTVRAKLQELYDWWHDYYNKQYIVDCKVLWLKVEQHLTVSDWVNIEGTDL